MTELPSGWCATTIGEIVRLRGEKALPSTVPHLPFLGLEDVEPQTSNVLRYGSAFGVRSAGALFSPGEILYGRLRPYLNKVAIAEVEGLASAEFLVLQSEAGVAADFVRRRIMADDFLSFAALLDRGDRPRVQFEQIATFPVALPPANEQRRILAKLNTLLAGVVRARKELDRVPTLIARHKQSLLAAAFSGELTRGWRESHPEAYAPQYDESGIDGRARERSSLPAQWLWTSMGAIALVSGGLTKGPKRRAIPTQAPYLRVANVYANELRLDDVSSIGCTPTELEKTRLRAGDLLIVEGNGSLEQIGRVALWDNEIADCSHQNHIIRARVNADVLPRFALYWMLSPPGRSFIEHVASSSAGLHTLSISKIQGLPIPVCSLGEQQTIVQLVDKAFAWLDAAADEHLNAASLLPKLEQSILAKAFRGELAPQDPADEPASVLLERISAERASNLDHQQSRRARGPRVPRAPEEKSSMTKSRSDEEVKGKPYLAGLLKQDKGATAVDLLFRRADLPVADFYKQLAWEVAEGHVIDSGEKLEAAA